MAQHRYDGTGIFERLREFRTLFIFIIASSIISLIVMNILTFPIALFAVTDPHLFTVAVRMLALILIASFVVFMIIRRIRHSMVNGIPLLHAFSASLISKVKIFLSFLILAFISIILIAVFYYILSHNYKILYELMQ
jgi:hypothetical protein